MLPLNSVSSTSQSALTALQGPGGRTAAPPDDPLQKTFQQAIAGLFFGELMKSLRSTVGEPAYLHGGQAEKMFQSQMDQYLVEDLAEQSGAGLVDDLYRQFRVQLGLPVETVPWADSASLSDRPMFPRRSEPSPAETTVLAVTPAETPFSGSPDPSEFAKSAESLPAAELLELARQARSVFDRNPDTTPTAVLSGLFRK